MVVVWLLLWEGYCDVQLWSEGLFRCVILFIYFCCAVCLTWENSLRISFMWENSCLIFGAVQGIICDVVSHQ
jgi:hypothetical protein